MRDYFQGRLDWSNSTVESEYTLGQNVIPLLTLCRTTLIIFPSYFSQIKTEKIPNIALFGNPVASASGDLHLESIDRVQLRTANCEISFGPTFKY